MKRIVILTGSPGAGKTTLAARLASASARGVHVRGDAFFTFLAHPIAPVLPESRAQNETVIRATLRTCVAFTAGDYEVFLDGIFGPWFLPVVAEEVARAGIVIDYVVLRVSLDEARVRATTRLDDPAEASVVEQMHAAFASLGPFEHHALDASRLTPAQLADEFARRAAAGELHLDLERARRAGRDDAD